MPFAPIRSEKSQANFATRQRRDGARIFEHTADTIRGVCVERKNREPGRASGFRHKTIDAATRTCWVWRRFRAEDLLFDRSLQANA